MPNPAVQGTLNVSPMETHDPDNDALQRILLEAAFGRALLAAHALELTLSSCLSCHALENGYELPSEKLQRMTLGGLIKEFEKKFSPTDDLAEELDNVLFFRNELAHRISDMLIYKAKDKDWKTAAIEELTEIKIFFVETNGLLKPYLSGCYSALNFSKETLHEFIYDIYPGLK